MRRAVDRGARSPRDAIFVVVGNLWAMAEDRAQPPPDMSDARGPGGPALVDHCVAHRRRADAERLLDLVGAFGSGGGGVAGLYDDDGIWGHSGMEAGKSRHGTGGLTSW